MRPDRRETNDDRIGIAQFGTNSEGENLQLLGLELTILWTSAGEPLRLGRERVIVEKHTVGGCVEVVEPP
jgi:hypothetical protein